MEQKRNKAKEKNELEKKKAGSGLIWKPSQKKYNLNYDYRNHDNLNNHNNFLKSLNQTKKFKNANKNNNNNKLTKSNVLKSSSNRNKNNNNKKIIMMKNNKFNTDNNNIKNNQQNMYTYLYTSNNNFDTNDIYLNQKYKKEIVPTGKEIEFGKALDLLHKELINININDDDD